MSDSLSLIATHLLVPALFALWMGKAQHRSRFEWGLEFVAFVAYTGFIFFTGRWGMLSIYLRYLAPILLGIAAVRSGRRFSRLPRFASLGRREVVRTCLLAFIICLTLPLLIITMLSLPAPTQAIDVEFPFRTGQLFYVAEGGPHVLLNRRADRFETRYATLLQNLDRFGRARPDGATTHEDPANPGFVVYSPVDGVVEEWGATEGDTVESASRTALSDSASSALCDLTLRCADGVRLVVGGVEHSLVRGAQVKRGDVVGRIPSHRLVGDTGLWIHAYRSESTERVGVPLRFAGTYLMRNYLYQSNVAGSGHHRVSDGS